MTDKKNTVIKLNQFWPYQTVVLADLISRFTLTVIKKNSQLNLSQWRVLAAIADQSGRTSAQVVAVTPMDKGIVSRAVASLIESGMLEKRIDSEDRRRATLHMTKTGQHNYQSISKQLSSTLLEITVDDLASSDFSTILNDYILSLKDIVD
ncbi:MAG: MarR family transcriptional regulator [Arenicella sp.]